LNQLFAGGEPESIADFEAAAKHVVPAGMYQHLFSAAAEGEAAAAARRFLNLLRLSPKPLTALPAPPSLKTTLFGSVLLRVTLYLLGSQQTSLLLRFVGCILCVLRAVRSSLVLC
jgi:hypothetical protein